MRPILWYLALVGIPVVALLGILRLGAQLVPPRAVHGRYTAAIDSSDNPCVGALRAEREMIISQSGPRLAIRLGRIALQGVVAGDTIRAAAPLLAESPLRAAGCLTADTLRVVAFLQAGASRALAGQLLFEGCEACSPAPFRAAPVTESSRGGGA